MNGKTRQQRLAGFDDEQGSAAEGGPESATTRRPAGATTPVLSLQGQSVYVLDSHSLIYQVFHARPEMTGPAGQPVGAIDGFLRDVMYILDSRKPDYLLCAFDPPGKTFRHDLYEQYKTNRPAMPDDLQLQIPNILRFLAAMAIPVLSVAGYEADDVLATVARRAQRLGGAVLSGHERQGLSATDQRARQAVQHPQEPGGGCGGGGGAMGDSPGPGRRFPGVMG